MDQSVRASLLQLLGAGGFGVIVGWFTYFVNRYRHGPVGLGDLVTVVGVLGGGAVLAIFPARTDLFGAYGIGLFAGFFGYLAMLVVLVRMSPDFDAAWFLDGRSKAPQAPYTAAAGGTGRGAMAAVDDPV